MLNDSLLHNTHGFNILNLSLLPLQGSLVMARTPTIHVIPPFYLFSAFITKFFKFHYISGFILGNVIAMLSV